MRRVGLYEETKLRLGYRDIDLFFMEDLRIM